jgi:putative polymerase
MVLALGMVGIRLLPAAVLRALAPTFPFLILASVIGLAVLLPGTGDTLLGRLSTSGLALLHFDGWMLMGLSGPLPGFGDMGYAYVISRFGIPLCLVLITALFTLPMGDERGQRFRALAVLYIFTNFAVSGTSVFALKTAGVLWFLMGVLSASRPQDAAAEVAP